MTTTDGTTNQFSVHSPSIIIGGTLIGLGFAAVIAGMAVSGSALLSGVQRWIDGMERQPSDLAKETWAQAKAASAAAARAWQEEHDVWTGVNDAARHAPAR